MTKEEFSKKWENYWYYYKIHTIVAVFVIIVLAITITQCASRVEPDMTVMLVGSKYSYTSDDINAIEKVFENYTEDVNHDGKKYVQINSYNMNQDGKMLTTLQQKLVTEVQTSDAVLYVTDDNYYNQLSDFTKGGKFFENMQTVIPQAPAKNRILLNTLPDFKGKTFSAQNGEFTISLKVVKNNDKPVYKNSVEVLRKLLKNGGMIK